MQQGRGAGEGVGLGEGMSSPMGRSLERGLCHLPKQFLNFQAQNDEILCILGANFFTVRLPVLHQNY